MQNFHDYFIAIASIWAQYFAKTLSMADRDRALANIYLAHFGTKR